MTVKQFRKWLKENRVPDSFTLVVAAFHSDGTASVDDLSSLNLNGRCVQIGVHVDATRTSAAAEVGRAAFGDGMAAR
jgi:hypothetical protein